MGIENTPNHSDVKEYAESTIKQQPKHVTGRHQALMRRLAAGVTLGDAAAELGYTVQRASLVKNSPLFQEEYKKLLEDIKAGVVQVESTLAHMDGGVRKRLEAEALESLEALIALRDGVTSERVRQISAMDILDRAGYKSTDKVEARVELDASEGLVDALAIAMKEMKDDSSKH